MPGDRGEVAPGVEDHAARGAFHDGGGCIWVSLVIWVPAHGAFRLASIFTRLAPWALACEAYFLQLRGVAPPSVGVPVVGVVSPTLLHGWSVAHPRETEAVGAADGHLVEVP